MVKNVPKGHPIEKFVSEDGMDLDVKKLFLTFLVRVYEIVQNYSIPSQCKASETLQTVNYIPCPDIDECWRVYKDDVCINVSKDRGEFQRARHNSPWFARTKVGTNAHCP